MPPEDTFMVISEFFGTDIGTMKTNLIIGPNVVLESFGRKLQELFCDLVDLRLLEEGEIRSARGVVFGGHEHFCDDGVLLHDALCTRIAEALVLWKPFQSFHDSLGSNILHNARQTHSNLCFMNSIKT